MSSPSGQGDILPKTESLLREVSEKNLYLLRAKATTLKSCFNYLFDHYEILLQLQEEKRREKIDQLKLRLFGKTMTAVSWRVGLSLQAYKGINRVSGPVFKSIDTELPNRKDIREYGYDFLDPIFEDTQHRRPSEIVKILNLPQKADISTVGKIGASNISNVFIHRLSWMRRIYELELKREGLLKGGDYDAANPGSARVLASLVGCVLGAASVGHDLATAELMTVLLGLYMIYKSYLDLRDQVPETDLPRDQRHIDEWLDKHAR